MKKRIIVYSHGFGVRQTDRGLFTDIAAALPDYEHVMFDYNQADDKHNTLTVSPLTSQAIKLAEKLDEAKTANPGADINLICHSQGCVAAAMLHPNDIKKIILITPPGVISLERMLKVFGGRKGAVVDINGLSSLPRRDGSTTIVPTAYWQSIKNIDPIALYSQLSEGSTVTIIKAVQDEVLGNTDFSPLNQYVKIIPMHANHDFTGETRVKLIAKINTILNNSS